MRTIPFFLLLVSLSCYAQVNMQRNPNFGSNIVIGYASLPSTCNQRQIAVLTTTGALYICSSKNTWTLVGGGGYSGTATIASGSKALATAEIASGACTAAQTATATGTAATDVVSFSPNADPTAVTGYAVSASGGLWITAYPTTNTVNFKVCNDTSGALTPGALTLNWRVSR